MLDNELRNISENLDEDLTTLILRYEIFKNFEWERELGLLTKEKINKIGRLKEEFKNNEEKLLDSETKISKFLKWRIWKKWCIAYYCSIKTKINKIRSITSMNW